MATTEVPTAADSTDVHDQLRAATVLLERIAADWRLLDQLTAEDRRRLHQAIARLSDPGSTGQAETAKSRESRERPAGRSGAEPDGNPDAAPAAGRHHPQRVSAGALRGAGRRPRGGRRRTTTRERRTTNAEPPPASATSARRPTRASTTSTISSARRAPISISPQRTELADLRGRVALLTGGRVKIGYQAGLKLLRSGAHLIVTTRFPRDAAARYAQEADFGDWGHRLEIFGLDLRAHARASRRSAATWSPRASGSTSSSTTPARPSGVRPTSTRT